MGRASQPFRAAHSHGDFVRLEEARHPEVTDLEHAGSGFRGQHRDQDVGRLEVSVHDLDAVQE